MFWKYGQRIWEVQVPPSPDFAARNGRRNSTWTEENTNLNPRNKRSGGGTWGCGHRAERGLFWPVPALRPNYTRPVQTALLNSIDGAPPPISQPEPVDQQGTAEMLVAPMMNRCSSFFIQASNQMVFKPFSVPTIVCLQSIDFSVSALDHWTTGPVWGPPCTSGRT